MKLTDEIVNEIIRRYREEQFERRLTISIWIIIGVFFIIALLVGIFMVK